MYVLTDSHFVERSLREYPHGNGSRLSMQSMVGHNGDCSSVNGLVAILGMGLSAVKSAMAAGSSLATAP